jgi:hypothetical protein
MLQRDKGPISLSCVVFAHCSHTFRGFSTVGKVTADFSATRTIFISLPCISQLVNVVSISYVERT